MGSFMIYGVYAFFCILLLLVFLSLVFDTNKFGIGIMLSSIVLIIFAILAIYLASTNQNRENINPLQYDAGEKFRKSLSL
ncbi:MULTISPECIES: hypothetical protein [Staphylococcus]|uniref:Uncharacterized protein n=1 Tax=Staphylococcus equorum TaxID=246432 RepID=A0AAP7LUF6_9STAP|nr:hypothetical protein [Staphylococcus equorum]MDK9845246.1 hypothetical protein [Staphylococcus equorum]MDK9849066.1 hypothetical protein [Staphylococcus equorum]MDK9853115.1 hypothetical protein [Staphylococcus equorum]MDK9854374.1 hypothetical protein [Staphylococcus equorum]MDK9859297.1 hypothetical protein [Staphylococcus equorum]